MTAKHGYLSISRRRSIANALRGYSISVDDRVIDKIRSGETKKYALPVGSHSVQVSMDYYKSQPLSVELSDGGTACLECGDAASRSADQPLSLGAVGASLKAMVMSPGYLFLRPVGTSNTTIGPVHQPTRGSSVAQAQKSTTIFLSYRREDSRAITGRISDRLTNHFGAKAVFRDVDSIPIGVDFREQIRATIDKADVLIAIIGPRWLDMRNEDNERRLDLPGDFVRLEIEEALARDIPVVPVLVDATEMPESEDLPEALSALAYRNALFIPREPFFHAGVDKLVAEIEGIGRGESDAPAANNFCTGCGKPLTGTKFCTSCGEPAKPAF